jgi:hypothetical protein
VRNRITIWLTTVVRDGQTIICCKQSLGTPDVPRSTKHSLRPVWLHNLIQTLAHDYAGRGLLVNCAQLSGNISGLLGYAAPNGV